jgi:membrane protein YdbS with pleckstrin-like domain
MGYDRELIRAGERPDPAGWVQVSPRLATARRMVSTAVIGLITLFAAVGSAFTPVPWLAGIVAAVGLLLIGWLWWLIGRQVAATAYSERSDDLVVRSGIMFRRTVLVPYGRMQLVDVTTGPIDRYFGIAAVQLHTAAATTDAAIPGLPTEDAARLRDHLAALGEARSAGL